MQIDGFADAIREALETYESDILKIAKESAEEAGEAGVELLKKTSPRRVRSGKYARSWETVKTLGPYGTTVTIRNKKHYRLTHLLEKGHQNRDGGRTPGIPHIAPAEEEVVQKFVEDVTEGIKNAGA